jgi:hypothetical protein
LARASPWALGEELFVESQKKFSTKTKILGEEFFVENKKTKLSAKNSSPRAFPRLLAKKF